MFSNKKTILTVGILITIIFFALALAGCNNSPEVQKMSDQQKTQLKRTYTPEEIYNLQETSKAITNKKTTAEMIDYLSSEESQVFNNDQADAEWSSLDQLTTYSFTDMSNNVMDREGIKNISPAANSIILRISSMIPIDAETQIAAKAMIGREIENYTEVKADKGDRAIGIIKNDNEEPLIITAERANGNDNLSFVVKVYINGTKDTLKEKLNLNNNATDDEIFKAFKETDAWQSANNNFEQQ